MRAGGARDHPPPQPRRAFRRPDPPAERGWARGGGDAGGGPHAGDRWPCLRVARGGHSLVRRLASNRSASSRGAGIDEPADRPARDDAGDAAPAWPPRLRSRVSDGLSMARRARRWLGRRASRRRACDDCERRHVHSGRDHDRAGHAERSADRLCTVDRGRGRGPGTRPHHHRRAEAAPAPARQPHRRGDARRDLHLGRGAGRSWTRPRPRTRWVGGNRGETHGKRRSRRASAPRRWARRSAGAGGRLRRERSVHRSRRSRADPKPRGGPCHAASRSPDRA